MTAAWLPAWLRRPERPAARVPDDITVVTIADNLASGVFSGVQTVAGWAQSRLEPQVGQAVETRLYGLTTRVDLAAYDDPDFRDRMERARDRGCSRRGRWGRTGPGVRTDRARMADATSATSRSGLIHLGVLDELVGRASAA